MEAARYSNMDPLNKYSYLKDGASTQQHESKSSDHVLPSTLTDHQSSRLYFTYWKYLDAIMD